MPLSRAQRKARCIELGNEWCGTCNAVSGCNGKHPRRITFVSDEDRREHRNAQRRRRYRPQPRVRKPRMPRSTRQSEKRAVLKSQGLLCWTCKGVHDEERHQRYRLTTNIWRRARAPEPQPRKKRPLLVAPAIEVPEFYPYVVQGEADPRIAAVQRYTAGMHDAVRADVAQELLLAELEGRDMDIRAAKRKVYGSDYTRSVEDLAPYLRNRDSTCDDCGAPTINGDCFVCGRFS